MEFGLVTDVLKGSKSAKIRSLGFDRLSTYGIMKEYSKDTIKEIIYFLITENYIKSVGNQYPVLVLGENVKENLSGDRQVFIKRKFEKIDVNLADSKADYDVNLFEVLRDLRRSIAEKNKIPPFIVFADASLKEMCKYFPFDRYSMLGISGVGVNKLENYGDAFIKSIKKYVDDNNVDLLDKPVKCFENKEKITSKEDTKIVSYNLFMKDGKSIDEISEIRSLTKRTIEEHLLKCYEASMDIDLSEYINEDFKDIIYEAIKDVGYERLRAIKDFVPDEVDYFNIKYFVIRYKKEFKIA